MKKNLLIILLIIIILITGCSTEQQTTNTLTNNYTQIEEKEETLSEKPFPHTAPVNITQIRDQTRGSMININIPLKNNLGEAIIIQPTTQESCSNHRSHKNQLEPIENGEEFIVWWGCPENKIIVNKIATYNLTFTYTSNLSKEPKKHSVKVKGKVIAKTLGKLLPEKTIFKAPISNTNKPTIEKEYDQYINVRIPFINLKNETITIRDHVEMEGCEGIINNKHPIMIIHTLETFFLDWTCVDKSTEVGEIIRYNLTFSYTSPSTEGLNKHTGQVEGEIMAGEPLPTQPLA